ncbi:PAS domain-containing protein [Pseudomonas sp. Marseille-QA0892]
MPEAQQTSPFHIFLSGGGNAGELMRSLDWEMTPFGPPEEWPVALQTLVSVMLGAKQAKFIAWGPEQRMLYNDAYADILGLKHPHSFGRPLLEVWAESRDELAPIIEQVYAGSSVHMDDLQLTMHRHGYPEETHFAFSYTPVRDETGKVAGFYCPCVETTAQVLAERRLREEVERQRRLFDQAPGFIAVYQGPEHVFEFTNATHERLFGNRHVIGKPVREAYPDLIAGNFIERLDQVFRTGVRVTGVHMPFRMAGEVPGGPTERYINYVCEPITNELGQVTGIFVEGHDVTEQFRAEQALRAREQEFAALAKSLPNGMWTALPSGELDWVSDWLLTYTGVDDSKRLLSEWLEGWTHPEDQASVRLAWSAALQSGSIYEATFRLRRFDGQYGWHLVRAVPVYADTGEVLKWIGTTTDIHVQRQATEQLQLLNAELEHRVEVRTAERDRVWKNSRDLLAITEADGIFQAVNPAWFQVLGYSPQQLEGQSLYDFVWHEDIESTRDAIQRAASSVHLTSFENRYRHRDGSARWISWHSSNQDGICYFYGRHITEEKEQREALRQAEEQLRQSQKMEAIGQLTGGIAHDFNNLLGGILGSMGLIKLRLSQGRLDSLDRYVENAMHSTQRAAALTHRLLAFSRRQPLTPTPVDLTSLVADLEILLRRTIGPSYQLSFKSDESLWPTFCDPNQLESAILNLAINARDAMDNGGALLIELENCPQPPSDMQGDSVKISVTDNGTGMSPEVRARAIEPFFTTKPMGQGTGLGLSMVYGFAKQSNGSMNISSVEGQGTSVSLYLPRYFGDVQEETASQDVYPARSATRKKVVLVEDDEVILELVAEVIEETGYDALYADDGHKGLQIIEQQETIDLLITDIGIPGINGRDLATQAIARHPNLKVLFITGYDQDVTLPSHLRRSGVELMTKPFTIASLAERLQALAED